MQSASTDSRRTSNNPEGGGAAPAAAAGDATLLPKGSPQQLLAAAAAAADGEALPRPPPLAGAAVGESSFFSAGPGGGSQQQGSAWAGGASSAWAGPQAQAQAAAAAAALQFPGGAAAAASIINNYCGLPEIEPLPDVDVMESLRLGAPRGHRTSNMSSLTGTGNDSVAGFEGADVGMMCADIMRGRWLWLRELLVHDVGQFRCGVWCDTHAWRISAAGWGGAGVGGGVYWAGIGRHAGGCEPRWPHSMSR